MPIIAENQLKDLIEHPTQHRASGVVVALHYGKQLPQIRRLGRLAGFTRWTARYDCGAAGMLLQRGILALGTR
jgi:hypothetical protein